MFLDLNRFKTVNDTFSHWVVDQLLSSVRARLKACEATELLLRSLDMVRPSGFTPSGV